MYKYCYSNKGTIYAKGLCYPLDSNLSGGELSTFRATGTSRFILKQLDYSLSTGAHHQEPTTTPYCCHGVFTDRSIFSLSLSQIRIPTGTSVTNCNHKHGLMLTCRHDVDMFT